MDAESIDWDADDDHPLDHIDVCQLTTEIKDLVIENVCSILHSNERVPYSLIEPILDGIFHGQLFSPATLYALLASRFHFKKESKADVSCSKLWITRSDVCEELALSLLPEVDGIELAQSLLFEFYPLSDGTPADSIPTWFRVSAIELAIKGSAKRLLAHPMVTQILSEVWDGHLVLDPLVHKVHRPEHVDLKRLMNARRGVVVSYDFETTTVFKPSRLRVPKYRNWQKLVNLVIMITLYVITMGPSSSQLVHLLFQIWLFSFILDEIQVLRTVGGYLYFMTLWSMCDFATACMGVVYFALIICTHLSETPDVFRAAAYDVLAVCGVTLIPRIFSALEVIVGFSRTVISVRRMIIELIWCWIAITMFSVGFWAALAHFARGKLSQSEVFYDLVQILCGFTPAVWTTWREYPPVGAAVLYIFLFISQFVVTSIVTAALSGKVVETKDNSLEEYHFLNAVKTEMRIKSERQVVYFFSQPFNILEFFPLPVLRACLPTRYYLRVSRIVLKATHWHIFLCIYAYERLSNAIATRREKFVELQQQKLAREVQGSVSKRTGHSLRARSPSIDETVSLLEAVRGRPTNNAKFDLVESLLHTSQEHEHDSIFPTQSVSTLRRRRPSSSHYSSHAPEPHYEPHFSEMHEPYSSHLAESHISEHYLENSPQTGTPPARLREVIADLQRSNARLEEMLALVLEKLN